MHIDIVEVLGRELMIGGDLEHNVILVELGEDRRDQPLPEGVVKGVIDHLRGHAQPRSGVAIYHEVGFKTAGTLITGNVPQLGNLLQPLQELGYVIGQLLGVGIFKCVLILRAADPVLDGNVLYRLHVEDDPGNLADVRLQTTNNVGRAGAALVSRLQIDLKPANIRRHVRPINPDE